uniref:ATP-dependent DNA ligase n=1 Tax=Geladintestivirus 1 TaxID=3233133 RepID=A0AAU8MGG3_9CAUD
MKTIQLFKRDAKGNIITWEANVINAEYLSLQYGILGNKLHTEICRINRNAYTEITSRTNAKRKAGYKTISDLHDNAPSSFANSTDLRNYLNNYLPIDNTTIDGDKFCMLCKTLEDNTPFTKHEYFAQYKINGERCIVHLEKSNDLFNPIRCRYTSRKGTDWTDKLQYLDDVILASLTPPLEEMLIEEDAALDGELYIPGYHINEINSIIKNTDHPLHNSLQYWIYDIAVPNMTAEARQDFLQKTLKATLIKCLSKEAHLQANRAVYRLSNHSVSNIDEARNLRDKFISYGFEGLVIRDLKGEYQFGKRNLNMLKYKKIYDGYFTIVDIESQGRKSDLPLFTLRNDINKHLFQATINLPHDIQNAILINKNDYINRKAFVEYRERSGVKELPFHAKIINIADRNIVSSKSKPEVQDVVKKQTTTKFKCKF